MNFGATAKSTIQWHNSFKLLNGSKYHSTQTQGARRKAESKIASFSKRSTRVECIFSPYLRMHSCIKPQVLQKRGDSIPSTQPTNGNRIKNRHIIMAWLLPSMIS